MNDEFYKRLEFRAEWRRTIDVVYHFTHEKWLDKIFKEGLIPRVGVASADWDDPAAVFVTKNEGESAWLAHEMSTNDEELSGGMYYEPGKMILLKIDSSGLDFYPDIKCPDEFVSDKLLENIQSFCTPDEISPDRIIAWKRMFNTPVCSCINCTMELVQGRVIGYDEEIGEEIDKLVFNKDEYFSYHDLNAALVNSIWRCPVCKKLFAAEGWNKIWR